MYKVEFHDGYVEIQVFEKTSIRVFLDFAREVLENPQFRQGMNVLADYSQAAGMSFDTFKYADIERFASLIARHSDALKGSKLATVPSQDMDAKSVISLFDSILEYHGMHLDHRVFANRWAALAWLMA